VLHKGVSRAAMKSASCGLVMAAAVLLDPALTKPCLAQRIPATPTFDTWSTLEMGRPADRPVLPSLEKRGTYKSLGLWVGFGLRVLAVPFVWSACEKGPGSCHANEKTFIAGAFPTGGALLGLLVGSQFRKSDRSPDRNTAPDSVSLTLPR
jgi:hypothetical protein